MGQSSLADELRLGRDPKSMNPDAILFAISQLNMSARDLADLARGLSAATALPSSLVRLEGDAPSLPETLRMLQKAGHRTILVQPVGIPFPQSLVAWLPGALSSWQRQAGNQHMSLFLGQQIGTEPSILRAIADATLQRAAGSKPASTAKPSLGKAGWQCPPDFTHHVLVCTGPRCHYRDAASLQLALKAEINRQGIADQCLTSRTGCLFPCNKGPVVALYPKGEWYRLPDAESVGRFVSSVLVGDTTLPDLLIHTARQRQTSEVDP